MPHKAKTHEKYVSELKEAHPDIIALTFYSNNKTKMKFKHLTCGTEWWALPYGVLKDKIACPSCRYQHGRHTSLFTLQIIKEQIFIMSEGTIEYVSGYVNTIRKCKWKCLLCGREWECTPHEMLRRVRHGCKKCAHKYAGQKKITSLKVVIEQVRIATNDTVEYVSGYVDKRTKCWWKCKICGLVWETMPATLLSGCKCPVCVKNSMERPVREALNKKGIKYDNDKPLKDCKPDWCTNPLRPDFYIKTEKGILWIECDGKQHYEPIYGEDALEEQQARDKFKNEYCKQHGICLIRVTSNQRWGTKKHITVQKILELIKIGINLETKEIDFELFRKYDFNKEN